MGCGASHVPIGALEARPLHATEDFSLPNKSNNNNNNNNDNERRQVELPDDNGISSERPSVSGSSGNDKSDSPLPRPTGKTDTHNHNDDDGDDDTTVVVSNKSCSYTTTAGGGGGDIDIIAGRPRSVSPAPGLSEYATLPLRHIHKKLKRNHRVFRVCLTGGPCAGKSTFLTQLQTKLPVRTGYKVYCVPEAATLLVGGGMAWSGEAVEEQQLALLRVQLALEDQFYRVAMAAGQPAVVVSDRGTMDGRAFCPPATFDRLLRRLGATLEGLRDRYDAVLHLVTAASGAEAYYNLDNPARYEGLEGAVESDLKLRQVYIGHPMLRIIDNSTTFEEKLERGLAIVGQVIGQKFSMQNTTYYLVKRCPKELPVQYAVCTLTITVLCNSGFNDIRLLMKRENSSGDCMYFFNSIRNANGQGQGSGCGSGTHSKDGSVQREASPGHYEDLQAMHNAFTWADAGQRVKNEQRISSKEYSSLIKNRDIHRRDVVLRAVHFIHDDNRYEVTTIVEPIWAAGKQALTLECDDQVNAKFPSFIEVDREVPIDSFSTAFLISHAEMGPLYTSLAYAPVFTRGIMAKDSHTEEEEEKDMSKENTNTNNDNTTTTNNNSNNNNNNISTVDSSLDVDQDKTEVYREVKIKKTKKNKRSKHMSTEHHTPRLPLQSTSVNTVNNETNESKPVDESNSTKKNLINEFVNEINSANESISGAKTHSTPFIRQKLGPIKSTSESPSFLNSPPPPPPNAPPTSNPRGMIMSQH